MPNLKDVKRRIRSVNSTRKITKAMQMVSAAKMRKSQNAVLASRTYSGLAWQLINKLGRIEDPKFPLLHKYEKASKIVVLILSSNRGLVGSLNTNLLLKLREIERANADIDMRVLAFGKKGALGARRLGKEVLADFEKNDRTTEVRDIYPLIRLIVNLYNTGEYKKIFVLYNHFYSTLSQKPNVEQILPFVDFAPAAEPESNDEYIFEPDTTAVLEHLLPRILESRIYQTVLESNASEHSARMVMMKNATDAAGDLITDLTLTYNQLRQSKITTELTEITAGKLALEA